MSTTAVKAKPTHADYHAAFTTACELTYPSVDAFEERCGYGLTAKSALDSERLLGAAEILACPVKAHAPHWQHGRVIYAATRHYLNAFLHAHNSSVSMNLLDIGTAKGFSALCLLWALLDSQMNGARDQVTSVDVVSPRERVARNTVSEIYGLKTLAEILEPWPESSRISFEQSSGVHWLEAHSGRVHVAFVDGKHTGEVVRQEGKLLAERQERGDLSIFDDCQIPGVSVAVASLQEWYRIEYLEAVPRQYAIARRR